MKTIKMKFDTPFELSYWDNIIELEITYIPAGIVNILYEGKAPDLDVVEIIKENYEDIIKAVIAEQTRLAWELREKAWDAPEKNHRLYWNGTKANEQGTWRYT